MESTFGAATGCLASKSQMVKNVLDREVANRGWEKHCQVKGVGCLGLCSEGLLVSTRSGALYKKVSPPQMQATFWTMQEKHHCVVCFARRIYRSFTTRNKIVTENSGVIDPERIEDYIAAGGYSGGAYEGAW